MPKKNQSQPPQCDVEYVLAFRIFKFLEPGRYLQVKIDEGSNGAWVLKPDVIVNWLDYECRPAAISAAERKELLPRIVAEARKLGLWLVVPGVDETPRPKSATATAPARTVKPLLAEAAENAAPMDGEDVAIAHEAAEAAKRARGQGYGVGESADAEGASDLSNDPELLAFQEYEEISQRVPKAPLVVPDAAALRLEIENALVQIQPMSDAGLPVAESILRQLFWCRGALGGEKVEAAPGPLTLGDIGFREFDMHGNDPALAALLVRIQDTVQRAS